MLVTFAHDYRVDGFDLHLGYTSIGEKLLKSGFSWTLMLKTGMANNPWNWNFLAGKYFTSHWAQSNYSSFRDTFSIIFTVETLFFICYSEVFPLFFPLNVFVI